MDALEHVALSGNFILITTFSHHHLVSLPFKSTVLPQLLQQTKAFNCELPKAPFDALHVSTRLQIWTDHTLHRLFFQNGAARFTTRDPPGNSHRVRPRTRFEAWNPFETCQQYVLKPATINHPGSYQTNQNSSLKKSSGLSRNQDCWKITATIHTKDRLLEITCFPEPSKNGMTSRSGTHYISFGNWPTNSAP